MKRVKSLVLKAMREDHDVRNDDRLLMLAVYKAMGLQFMPEQEQFIANAEYPASIFRARARIQNQELRMRPNKG